MIFPALIDAMTDARLHRRDLTVYGAALEVLDFRDFRSWKLVSASHRTGMMARNIRRSIQRLSHLGYIEAAAYHPGTDARSARRYRLVFSPLKGGSQVTPVHAA